MRVLGFLIGWVAIAFVFAPIIGAFIKGDQ